MSKTIKVAEVGELDPGKGKIVELERQTLALFKLDGTYYAIDNTCSHVGEPVGGGALVGRKVTC